VKNALAALRASTHPSIVNVSSVSGLVAQRGTPAYVSSKGAVVMLSKALALDLAEDNIRVNCVCPGITDTPMLQLHLKSTSEPARTLRRRIHRVPLNRMLSPVEIADAILYLSSNHASGITGTELIIDAGYLAAAEAPMD
jgi:NAD(P)-dependent dehydrogenase (short-subunit alcohol dehydrogenase family)